MDVGAILFDIDGVLVSDWVAIPGAVQTLSGLDAAGTPYVLITNTTSHPRAEMAAILADAGVDVDPGRIVTAASATAAYLRGAHPGASAFVLNEGSFGDDMAGVELSSAPEEAGVMVIGGAGPGFAHDVLNRMFRRVMEGAPLVAMHRSRFWRSAEGFEMDAAAYVAALETASGVEAVVCGKPAPAFFEAALQVAGVPADRAVMVGDDVRTDVLAAQEAGLRGVLVRTGKYRTGDETAGRVDVVLESVADLPAWLAS